MLTHKFRPGAALKALGAATCLLVLTGLPAAAQSITTGGLTATVLDERGKPLTGVSVTLEKGGVAFLNQFTDSRGVVTFPVLANGRYNLLSEQLGYRPLRNTGLAISGGGQFSLTVRLAKATPGNRVDERPTTLSVSGSGNDRIIAGGEMHDLDRHRDLSDVTRGVTGVDAPRDARAGFATSANGLSSERSTLVVDGVEELMLRHGGVRTEPAAAPLFARDGFDQARVAGFGRDLEWPSVAGSILSGSTRAGSSPTHLLPWFAYSGSKLGGAKRDNPADSSGTSIEGGFRAQGGFKGDTGAWSIRAEYRQSQQPSANPFELATGATDPAPGILSVVQGQGHGVVAPWLAPTVRTWKGGDALARLDFQLTHRSALAIRAGMASWSENNPLFGNELMNGAGSRVESKDVSLAGIFSLSGDEWLSETRLGVHSGQRDWTGPELPYTGIVADNLALGGSPTAPGHFKSSQLELSEAFTSNMGHHTVKGVVDFRHAAMTDDWLPYGSGRFDFGDLASFTAGRGAFVQASRSGVAPSVSVTYPSIGVQDAWHITSRVEIDAGARLEAQKLPTGLLSTDTAWALASGLNTAVQPAGARGGRIAVRGGLGWSSDAANTTSFRVDAGISPAHFDLSALNEAIQNSGQVTIRRATGNLSWPSQSAASLPPVIGPVITMFNEGVKAPRAIKGNASLSHTVGSAIVVSVHASYDHTDYLLRRADLNLIQSPLGSATDGRPIFGTLEQYGALLTPAVGTNRRFRNVDMAYVLSSSGFADYAEAGVSVERRVAKGLSMNLSYAWSRTRDNLPGQLSNEPADQLSPFPGTTGHGSWDEGRSDFDVPSRAAATAEYASGAFTLSARYRLRSGLPFTPGFARGVDANGDGATGNDPAPIGNSIPGFAELSSHNSCIASTATVLAERNSCRDPAVRSLDLHLGFALPTGKTHPVSLLIDAFNVISSDVGIFDHAAVLVDPAGSLSYNSAGRLVMPLTANANFGQLLSRRGDPRMVRIGFRVEN